jgi:hypothetical protein
VGFGRLDEMTKICRRGTNGGWLHGFNDSKGDRVTGLWVRSE